MKVTIKGYGRRRRKQKPKGPNKHLVNSICMEGSLWAKVDKISKRNKITKNAVIRQIIHSYKGT